MQAARSFCVAGIVSMLIFICPGSSGWTYRVFRDCNHERKVICKYADHWRIRNERDVLLRFQGRTPHIRPLLDEVEGDERNDLKLILKHLDEDLLHTLGYRELTRAEVKHIGKGVLEALRVLHEDGFVHTGQQSKPDSRAEGWR